MRFRSVLHDLLGMFSVPHSGLFNFEQSTARGQNKLKILASFFDNQAVSCDLTAFNFVSD